MQKSFGGSRGTGLQKLFVKNKLSILLMQILKLPTNFRLGRHWWLVMSSPAISLYSKNKHCNCYFH
jgi:hypothetical protein